MEGLGRALGALRGLSRALGELTPAMRATVEDGARRARGKAPRRTGALAGSIVTTARPGVGDISTALIYAAPINYGWPARRISPSGFMSDTVTELAPVAIRNHTGNIETEIKKRGL